MWVEETPEEIIPELADKFIVSSGSDPCWYWSGKIPTDGTIRHRVKNRDISVRSILVRYIYPEYNKRGGIINICGYSSCLNPNHLAPSSSIAARWYRITESSVREGDCLVWKGKFSRGAPAFVDELGQKNKRVRLWMYEQETGHTDKKHVLKLLCDTPNCVEWSHFTYETIVRACATCQEPISNKSTHCEACYQKHMARPECVYGHILDTNELANKFCVQCRRNEVDKELTNTIGEFLVKHGGVCG